MENYNEKLRNSDNTQEKLNIVNEFVDNVMTKDEDYGFIAGFPKQSLFKSGAEKLASLFEVSPIKQVTYREIDALRPFMTGGKFPKEVMGYVVVEVTCSLVNKEGKVVGIGLGACSNSESKFAQDAGSVYNNVIKMAGKRSLVDAIMSLSLVSDKFTQDIEDMDKRDNDDSPKPVSRVSTTTSSSKSTDKSIVMPFGTDKGKTVSELDDNGLSYWAKVAQGNIEKNQFVQINEKMLDALKKEATERGIFI